MDKKKRRIFGVITADAADMEQREILSGIIENAQKHGVDVVVLSNIYNPIDSTPILAAENCIYDRIASESFEGFILLAESIINADLQVRILDAFRQRADVPIIVLGTYRESFHLPHFRYLNTSDENDLADITEHLVTVHGLTQIDILSGYENLEASHKRIAGYRRTLEAHGIPYDETRVRFGDFWTVSGRTLGEQYLRGERPMPQALICCNDYMAYGVLDAFMEHGVSIAEKMALTGYEYVRSRHAHHRF